MALQTIFEEQAEQQQVSFNEDFEQWRLIDPKKLTSDKEKRIAYRLNSLGSFYFFSKVTLHHNRFVDHFHKPLAESIEGYHLQKVIEVPRDHFKTTLFSESAPMWWSLPFTSVDEDYMRALGYSDNFINWMKRAHDRDTNTLVISETIDNAIKIGIRINNHYANNSLFRNLFPEILPDEQCKWTEKSMAHKRTKDSVNGEGTFDFLGVGGALQSRHYKRMIEDDLVGRKALKGDTVMNDTIEYHKLLVGAFDSSGDDKLVGNDEIVVGNRWSEKDLNQWMRDNEDHFEIINHSALGGCCKAHPLGKILFPEEFTLEKLEKWKKRLGPYLFSCQFLNDPVAPGATRWTEDLLNYYEYGLGDEKFDKNGNKYRPVKLVHETKNGKIIKDVWPRELLISMVVDPNHSGSDGSCRHAITVTGLYKPLGRLYLLDCFAESVGYEQLVEKIFEWAEKWSLRKVWLETVAAQKYLKFHLDQKIATLPFDKRFKIEPLKTERTENGKALRIEAMDPFYFNNQFFCSRHDTKFVEEFRKYPVGKTVDILDTLGYAPQTWENVANAADVKAFVEKQNAANPFAHQVVSQQGRSELTGY